MPLRHVPGRSLSAILLASAACWLAPGFLTGGAACAQVVQTPAEQAVPSVADAKGDVVVIVGSQIVGAQVNEALPVTVVGRQEIEGIAAASGDDLFRSIPQLGDVAFNTSRTIGSVNDARGDTASINLRALGTGNTLVLLNGRRMVNHPGTQAENLVPVVTVNTNSIPVSGVQRIEVLLDGASAIYGADAVAGVVNTVLKTDFNGFTAEGQIGQEQGINAVEYSGNFEFGINSDDGATNFSLLGSIFSRDPIFASERSFTANADLRSRLPALWAADTAASGLFNNTSTTSAWAGLDRFSAGTVVVNGTTVTNAAGQFHIQPNTLTGCLAQLPGNLCIGTTSTRNAELRYNVNDGVSTQNGVDRYNLFSTLNHEFGNGVKFFGEAGVYLADSLGFRESAPMLGAVPIVIPASNYWNPFGPVGSPNRLANTNAPAQGLDIQLVGYRPVDAGPRRTEVENISTRVLAGLKGVAWDWNWESALLYSQANTEDEENRVSNTLFQQSLALNTPDAYNPFNGGCLTNLSNGDCTPSSAAALEAISVPVFRRDMTSLASWDLKLSKKDLFRIWAGDIGVAAGVEVRHEEFTDNRDPRQDGKVTFTDTISGLTTNDLLGNSGSLDTHGERDVQSAYAEFAVPLVSPDMNVPLVQDVNMQLAVRYENFDTFGDVTKPKVALSWRPLDFLLFRSSWSEGFRAPNLQQQFESGLQRSNTRTDLIFCEADLRAKRITAAQFTTSCPNRSQSVISNRQGSASLDPEESKNLSYGAVFESTFLPPEYGKFTLTADWWRIEQENVVGIFGDDNHILLDYVLRVQGKGGDPAVVRAAPTADDTAAFAGTGLTPVGQILFVNDNYLNLDQRTVQGWDFGLYYAIDQTPIGDFDFRINAAFLDKFFQGVSPNGVIINQAAASGQTRPALTVGGQGDLIRNFGRPEWRYTAQLTWKLGAWQAGWFTSYVGDVTDPGIVLAATGQRWIIDDFQTHNLYLQYTLGKESAKPTRLRLGVRNIFDEEPPLADTNFGYLGDINNPAGRFVYINVRKTF